MPLQIQAVRFAPWQAEDNASEQKVIAKIRCALPEVLCHEKNSALLTLCLQIHAVNLDTSAAALLFSETWAMPPQQMSAERALIFHAPAVGRYRLHTVAFLLGVEPEIAVRVGPTLRVEGEDGEETESAGENIEAAGSNRTEALAGEYDNKAQAGEAHFGNELTNARTAAEEFFHPKEAAPTAFSTTTNEAAACVPTLREGEARLATIVNAQPICATSRFVHEASPLRFLRLAEMLHLPLELLSLIGLIAFGFSCPLQSTCEERQSSVLELERSLLRLQAIAQGDSARSNRLKRIGAIMARYSPPMTPEEKFAVASTIEEMTLKYSNLDLELICATITHETGRTWDPRSMSPVGARGLMQIMPFTGEMLARAEEMPWHSPEQLFDPIANVRLGCRYLSTLVQAYQVDGGLAAYNGGEKRAELWLRQGRATGILAEETSFYVPSILKLYAEYRRLRG